MLLKNPKPQNLQKILLYPVPEPLKPEPFFNIQPPEPHVFPLETVKLQSMKLIDSFFPQDINKRIEDHIKSRIERIGRFRQRLCVLGRGRGFLCADAFMDLPNITAFAYGPNNLLLAFEDRSVIIYTMELKLVKQLKDFSDKRISFIKIISIPKQYENTILTFSSGGYDLCVTRIQKSFFSGMSVKFKTAILTKLTSPITHIVEIPQVLKNSYLSKDNAYQDSNLVGVMAVDRLWIIKITNSRIMSQKFWQIIYEKKFDSEAVNSISWGQAHINSTQKQIFGDRLVLTYSFGCQLFLAVLHPVNKYLDGEVRVKYEWVESFPFKIQSNKNIAFCQYMKKNEILLILQTNQIIIFHTGGVQLFDKQIKIEEIATVRQKFEERLKCRTIETISKKTVNFVVDERLQDLTPQQILMLNQIPLVTFADTFSYDYPSNQIYFLTERKFGIYLYYDWKQISDHLKVQQKYQVAMNFLIALYKKANRFDLGLIRDSENLYHTELSEYAQILASQFITKKFSSLKNIPQLLKTLNVDLLVSIPIDFLVTMNEFAFLFEVLRHKIVNFTSQTKFYQILEPFIYHGKIKYIPESEIRPAFDYYIKKDRLDIIERLSINFDLKIIDKGTVIQYLLQHTLVVSLAYVCTQGNQNQFITPFAKLWGLSENQKSKKNMEKAKFYSLRALWYVKICLQRNMALKQYSVDKYAHMMNILTNNFFTKKMIKGLLEIDTEACLETLSYYFSIEISNIVNQSQKFKVPDVQIHKWIKSRQGNQKIQLLLSAIYDYLTEVGMGTEEEHLFYLLLSRIIIYKTIKFTRSKYRQILEFLIKNYTIIHKIKYGLDVEKIKNYQQLCSQEEADQILSSEYISKILVLAMQEQINKQDLSSLYEASRRVTLTELQAHISLLQNNYKMCIEIYLRGRQTSRKRIFKFLENTFKNFTIGKCKNQLEELTQVLGEYVNVLISLDPKLCRNLIQAYMPDSKQDLVFALDNDQNLQLDFLSEIVSDLDLSQRAILKYIELMCKKSPQKLADAFKAHSHFPVQESLRICEQYKAFDCMQYLYERMGNVQKSVEIASYRIDSVFLQRFKNDLDPEIAYSKIDEILSNAIAVCIKNHTQSIWQSLLDSSIVLFNKYKEDSQYNGQIAIFYNIIAKILYEMVNHSSIEYTIDLFQNKYKNLDMGGTMKKAFIQILSNFSYLESILFSSTDLNKYNYSALLYKRLINSLKAFHPEIYCFNCEYPIVKSQKSIAFFCGHTYHKDCVVDTNPYNCVSCLYQPNQQLNFYLSIPNPQNPKIKIEKLFEEYDKLKLENKEKWKIFDYEQSQRTDLQQIKAQEQNVKKKDKFKAFDDLADLIQYKNQQIMAELEDKFNSLRVN